MSGKKAELIAEIAVDAVLASGFAWATITISENMDKLGRRSKIEKVALVTGAFITGGIIGIAIRETLLKS